MRSAKGRKYAHWLNADYHVIKANAMVFIIGRAMNMLKGQIKAQGRAFAQLAPEIREPHLQ